MRTALTGGSILVAGEWQHNADLVIEGDLIAEIRPAGTNMNSEKYIDISDHFLVPGFIDTQVNGGGGAFFNDAPTVDTLRTIASAHQTFGTTALLPTLISDDLDIVAEAIAAVDSAIQLGVPGVVGIHIEGPFLSSAKKGVHNPNKFRRIDEAAVALLTSLKNGVTLVTLAPEETTPDMIARLVEAGVIVSAGHTNATYGETIEAVDAGLTGFTHLYNAMAGLNSREPGVVGAALDNRSTYAGVIVDGHHVHAASLRIAMYAKGTEKIMLVTDAMPSVGAADKNFILQGHEITVEGGRCTTVDGTLAGSDLDMASAVRNAAAMLEVPLAVAVQMASANPARFLGLEGTQGDIKAGMRADLVLLDSNQKVQQVWISGNSTLTQ